MASEYRYVFAQRAVDDLDSIASYIAVELANPTAASDLFDAIEKALREVCAFPESGPAVVNEYLPISTVRKLTIKNYIMYYVPDHSTRTIQILRVIYGRRDMDEILKELGEKA